MTRLVSAEEARGLLEGAPGPLTAELDVFDPDEREAEASVNDEGVSVLFTSGTGEMFPTGTQNATDLARWLALNDSKPMRYARLFAAAPDLAATVIALSEEIVAAESLAMSWSTLAATASNERDRLRAILACERGESAPEGWTRCGGLLREWERNYGKGVHGRVKADGRWWVGKLGILDPLGDSSSPPVTHAEGPAGLKLDGIESADRAAAPQ